MRKQRVVSGCRGGVVVGRVGMLSGDETSSGWIVCLHNFKRSLG